MSKIVKMRLHQNFFKLRMFNLQGNVSREFRGALDASLIKPPENPSPGVFQSGGLKSGDLDS